MQSNQKHLCRVKFTRDALESFTQKTFDAYSKMMSSFVVIKCDYDYSTETFTQILMDPFGEILPMVIHGSFIVEKKIIFEMIDNEVTCRLEFL